MISNKKVVEAAKTIVDYCKQQDGCQNCIFRSFGCDHWKSGMCCQTLKRKREITATYEQRAV